VGLTDEQVERAFRESSLFQEFEKHLEAGDDVPDSSAKRHHFIPQFLLRRFLAPGKERLFQLDTHTGKPQAIAPADAASRRHFYSVIDEEGVRHAKIESFLSTVESHAANALTRFTDAPLELDPGDRATLSYFFALFGIRTPRAVAKLAAGAEAVMHMAMGGRLSHPDVFARDYTEIIGEASEEEIEELRLEMLAALEEGRVTREDARAHAIAAGLHLSTQLATLIFSATWTVLAADEAFVTSDTGLAMYDPAPPFPWTGNGWASSPYAVTTIPVGLNECLLISAGEDGETQAKSASGDEIDMINLRTYGWASDYIFGASQQAVADLRTLAKRRPQDVVRPRPEQYVILVDASPSDTSLAQQHRRRGWPPYLGYDGEMHDYIVVGVDGTPVESGARASQLARERATEAQVTPPLE
jgi:hypothetical protein